MTDLFCSAQYDISSAMYDDPIKWVTSITGKVTSYEEDDSEIVIAKTKYFYVDLNSAVDEGYFPGYILDLQSETVPYIEALYRIGLPEFNKNALNVLEYDGWSLNLLIIDRIEILPNYRGRGLSKQLIDDAARIFASRADVVALKPFPLQHEGKLPNSRLNKWGKSMKLKELEKNEVRAFSALLSHYQKLGFKVLGYNNVMAKLID